MGDEKQFAEVLQAGYAGAQLGTRFIATHECKVTDSYKRAIVSAASTDIVWTNKLAGTNSSVIRTPQAPLRAPRSFRFDRSSRRR